MLRKELIQTVTLLGAVGETFPGSTYIIQKDGDIGITFEDVSLTGDILIGFSITHSDTDPDPDELVDSDGTAITGTLLVSSGSKTFTIRSMVKDAILRVVFPGTVTGDVKVTTNIA